MALPIRYNVRHVILRWRTTALTVLGMALVVAMLVCMMSLANGLSQSLIDSGDPRNVMVLRDGATSETNSVVDRDLVGPIQFLPEVARDANDRPMVALETVNIVVRPKATGGSTNAIIRGTGPNSLALRPQVKVVEGRWYRPGLRELVVGSGATTRFQDARVGDRFRLMKSDYTVVGRFDSGPTAFNSEFWGDCEELNREFDRSIFSSMLMRVKDGLEVEALIKRIDGNQRLATMMAKPETKYYEEQTRTAAPLKFLGYFLACVMAIGAVFASMNTMYAAVASRSWEIATLRVLGFRRGTILTSFVLESTFLGIIGGVLGGLMALPMNGVATGTSNFDSFSEVTFAFRVSPDLLLAGVIFSAFMGAIGGFLPALQASRKDIVTSLRQG